MAERKERWSPDSDSKTLPHNANALQTCVSQLVDDNANRVSFAPALLLSTWGSSFPVCQSGQCGGLLANKGMVQNLDRPWHLDEPGTERLTNGPRRGPVGIPRIDNTGGLSPKTGG
jgi:hypothetical protein